MKKYIDGFVIPIATDKLAGYEKMAQIALQVWKEHGALEYIEAVGDNLTIKGESPFSKMAGLSDNETVVFAYIVYESREHRDAVNAKVMADPRIQQMCPEHNPDFIPSFDPGRMAYGGFRVIVS